MERRTKVLLIVLVSMLACWSGICAILGASTVSGAVSYGVGFYGLTQYAEGNNEWIEHLNQTCEKKPPARRGRSHNEPEWTDYYVQ